MRIVRIVRESVDRRVDGHDGGPKLGRQPFETCQRSLPRSAQRLKLRNNKKPKEQNMKQEICKLYIRLIRQYIKVIQSGDAQKVLRFEKIIVEEISHVSP